MLGATFRRLPLSDFRVLHLKELAALFVQVVKLARECGLVKLGTIAVEAPVPPAGKGDELSADGAGRASESAIDQLLARAKATDAAERDEPENGCRRRSPARGAAGRIKAAKERLEARQREVDIARGRAMTSPDAASGTTKRAPHRFRGRHDRSGELHEPDSRIMKHAGGGFEQSYNAHTAVDATHKSSWPPS